MSFDGRFSTEKSREALELEQKHEANYTKNDALSGSEMKKTSWVNLLGTN